MRLEPLSQRVLVVILRTEIDRARRRQDPNAAGRAIELSRLHPHAMTTNYVRHNVGMERLAWLSRTRGSHGQVDANPPSLAADSDSDTEV
jgi:hypothetical protein